VIVRLPKHNDRGFTLIEMMVVIGIVGILAGIAAPSFLSLNKPLREAVSQFQSQLSLIRTKAISSNKAYRIRPKYPTRIEYATTEYPAGNPNKFIVEYAANCRVTTIGGANGWQAASQLDLDLPPQVGIASDSLAPASLTVNTSTIAPAPIVVTPVTISTNLINWNICFDNRGIVGGTPSSIILQDFQDNNKAKLAVFVTSAVGGTDVYLYNKVTDTAQLPEGNF
jgi:prepilin-type N-terminal cleavage/methylation domain-containing protein